MQKERNMKTFSWLVLGILMFVMFGTSIRVLALQDTISTAERSMLQDDCLLFAQYVCLNTKETNKLIFNKAINTQKPIGPFPSR